MESSPKDIGRWEWKTAIRTSLHTIWVLYRKEWDSQCGKSGVFGDALTALAKSLVDVQSTINRVENTRNNDQNSRQKMNVLMVQLKDLNNDAEVLLDKFAFQNPQQEINRPDNDASDTSSSLFLVCPMRKIMVKEFIDRDDLTKIRELREKIENINIAAEKLLLDINKKIINEVNRLTSSIPIEMMGCLAETIINSLIERVWDMIMDSIEGGRCGVRDVLSKLVISLINAQAAIRKAENMCVGDESFKRSMKIFLVRLKDAAYDADDWLDRFQLIKPRRKESGLSSSFSSFTSDPVKMKKDGESTGRDSMAELKMIQEKLDNISMEEWLDSNSRGKMHAVTELDAYGYNALSLESEPSGSRSRETHGSKSSVERKTKKNAAPKDGRGDGGGCGSFDMLPRDFLVLILSLTTPRDLCRLAAVSKCFLSVAESDAAWERFLPPDCASILSGAVHPAEFSSKKELYLRLCQPILFEFGKMSFQLEKSTGKKTYMVSAEMLDITWYDDPRYWIWISLPESRFKKVAKLVDVCWLDISGSISSHLLSPKTIYVVYIVFKLAINNYGLDSATQYGSISLGTYMSEKRVSLELEYDDDNDDINDDDTNIDHDEKMREDEDEDEDEYDNEELAVNIYSLDSTPQHGLIGFSTDISEKCISLELEDDDDIDIGYDDNVRGDEDEDDNEEKNYEDEYEEENEDEDEDEDDEEEKYEDEDDNEEEQYEDKDDNEEDIYENQDDNEEEKDKDEDDNDDDDEFDIDINYHKKMKKVEKGARWLRDDGWLELSLGEFYNDEGDEGDVYMSLRETTQLLWKRGLILLGFELRPKLTT